jgi:hypothetical protein
MFKDYLAWVHEETPISIDNTCCRLVESLKLLEVTINYLNFRENNFYFFYNQKENII